MTKHKSASPPIASECISVILPVYNEEENLIPLHEELMETMTAGAWQFEIIWIDDHSTDKSYQILKELQAKNTRNKVFRLRRNMGQTQAIAAGLSKASGDIIVFLDADRQNPPQEIPKLLKELENGYDIITGWRKQRKDGFFLRRLPSICANSLISWLLGFRVHDYGCALKAYRRQYLKDIQFLGDTHRLLLAYAVLNGASVQEIEVAHRPREGGKSKYGLSRTFKVLLDLFVIRFFASFSTRPAHFFGSFGLFLVGISLLLMIVVIIRKWMGGVWMSPLLIISSTAFFSGFNILVLSLAVEILYRGLLKNSNLFTFSLEEDEADNDNKT